MNPEALFDLRKLAGRRCAMVIGDSQERGMGSEREGTYRRYAEEGLIMRSPTIIQLSCECIFTSIH